MCLARHVTSDNVEQAFDIHRRCVSAARLEKSPGLGACVHHRSMPCFNPVPHVLDTGLLGRPIHNGHVTHNKIKYSNISEGQLQKAWEIVDNGLQAGHCVTLFTDSIAT